MQNGIVVVIMTGIFLLSVLAYNIGYGKGYMKGLDTIDWEG